MRIVSVRSLRPSEVKAWEELSARAAEPNPFFDPDFVIPAARLLDTPPPDLLVLDRGGEWVGCIPVGLTRVLGKRTALSGWTHPYCHVGTPLVRRGHVGEFARALTERLEGWRQSSFMALRRAVDGGVVSAIRDAVRGSSSLDIIAEQKGERAAVKRRKNPESPLAALKPRRRREHAKRRRRLAEEMGAELTVSDRCDEAAVEEFLELEASGWKGREGTAMAACNHDAWFREVCMELARRRRLQLLALEAEERTVAMQCNIRGGDVLFNFKVAFDERFKRHAPGIQLEVEAIRVFQETREERLMDSCAEPDNELINRLWRDRQPITSIVVGPGGATAGLTRSAIRGARAVRSRVRDARARRPSNA